MGKNYKTELSNMDIIYRQALEADVSTITAFLQENLYTPLVGIGSGGSFSVAKVMEFLCKKSGIISQSVTPLEICNLTKVIRNIAIMLFTAGGSNNDSKNSYDFISMLEPKGLITCCMHMNAPIKKLQRNNLHEFYYEYRMPVAKDGYLAVESFVSSIVILINAFRKLTRDKFFELSESRKWELCEFDLSLVSRVLSRESIIVLHGGITTPAAFDLESKFSEVSLGNVSLVDFRNFAHGRHFWLSDRKNTTSVIALVGTSEQKLADRTLKLLPQDIPVLRKDVSDESVNGLIDAIWFVLQIVLEAGNIRGLDPGRPKVEEFGKKLYHLNYNICSLIKSKDINKDRVATALYRKNNMCGLSNESPIYLGAQRALANIFTHNFKGIIFDYDGTLHDKRGKTVLEETIFEKIGDLLEAGIYIGVSTGRGRSVREELQKVISEKHWAQVVICYYNGAVTACLNDNTQPNKAIGIWPEDFDKVKEFADKYIADEEFYIDGLEEKNPYQLTLFSKNLQTIHELKEWIISNTSLKIVQSSHSIDIIPNTSSKNNIMKEFKKLGMDDEDFLRIGDSGHLGGNDFELLSCEYGLSVDTVSSSMIGCWNFAKLGKRNLEATKEYLDMINVLEKGLFQIGENE